MDEVPGIFSSGSGVAEDLEASTQRRNDDLGIYEEVGFALLFFLKPELKS